MGRISALAAVGMIIFGLAGCDEDGSAKKTGKSSNAVVSDTGPSGGSASFDSSAPSLARNVGNQSAAGPASTDESTASNASALFDGTRQTGAVNVHPTSTPVLVSSREDWRSAPKLAPNARPRTVALDKGGGVPKPGTLPVLDLPTESAAEASAGAKGGGPVLLALEAFEKKFYDNVSPIFSRAAWGARAARFQSYHQTPTRVTVHHTDGKQYTDQAEALAYVKSVQTMHMNTRDPKHGWDDIGYHFLIDGAGRVYEGRHADVMGAHAQGANENNVGISLMGDYNKDKPTAPEIESLRRLVTFLALKYRTDPRQRGFIEPHKHYNNTDCPGNNVVALLAKLNEDVDGDVVALTEKLGGGTKLAANTFVPLLVTQPSNS